jgi:hypothetical protein
VKDKQAYLEGAIPLLLDSLGDEGELDVSMAAGDISLALPEERKVVRVRRPTQTKVRVQVCDRVTDSALHDRQGDDYILETERGTFADRFGFYEKLTAPRKPEPMHRFYMGEIVGGTVDLETLDRMGAELRDPVPFLGIGVLTV